MINLAPRQGLFAVVILASVCLHILFFVVTGVNRQESYYTTHATMIAKQLGQELELPLSIHDPVGASVVAARYSKDPAIAFIGVYDNQNRLIAPVGNKDAGGSEIASNIGQGTPFGKVIIRPNEISRAAILAEFWPYLLGVMFFHALIWFFYGHIARPDEGFVEKIRTDTRNQLIAKGIPLTHEPNDTPAQTPVATPTQSNNNTPTHIVPPVLETDKKGLFGGLFEILKQKDPATPQTDTTANATHTPTADNPLSFGTVTPTPVVPAPAPEFSYYAQNHSGNEKMGDNLYVYFNFIDDNNLLGFLEENQRNTYLALCNQLLEKTAKKVLTRPVLSGIRIDEIIPFSYQNGQCVAQVKYSRSSSNYYARLALAGAMLAKLFPAVNQAVYNRHREINSFALPIKAIASDETRHQGALVLLQKRNEQSLLLLNNEDTNSITNYFGLARHKESSNLYEKECRIITTATDDMNKQLQELRNIILLQD